MDVTPTETRAPVTLRLLGRTGVHLRGDGDADAVLGQPKRLAVLAYATLRADYVRRESILALLWPDAPPKRSRQALRQSLYVLRETLGSDLFRRRGIEEIAVDPDHLWCDAVALNRAFESDDMEEVVRLHGGELLAGFHAPHVASEFEFWLDRERLRIDQRIHRAHRIVIRRHREAGDLEAAIGLARRAAAHDPTDESVTRQLMELLVEYGDRVGAVEVFDRFEARVREEFGIEPSDETRTVAEVARRSSKRGREARPAPSPESNEAWDVGPPEPLTPLIGRDEQLRLCRDLLGSPDVRLVSLVGAGGVGKTRLAIEVARERAEGHAAHVVYVPLSGSEADDPLHAVALRLGITAGSDSVREALRARLAGHRVLLVLDDVDLGRCDPARLVELLETVPDARALVTTVAPLCVSGEHEVPVPPLRLPSPERPLGPELPLDSEAVALFEARTRAVDPAFRLTEENVDAVVEICRSLDGLPLAIELAASRIRHLPVQAVAEQVSSGIQLLRGGRRDGPDRQRTMEAAIVWSVDQLHPEERKLLLALGIFVGEFGLDTVRQVLSRVGLDSIDVLEGLTALVDRGLVQRPRWVDDEPRYEVLSTVRSWVVSELERLDETDRWMQALAEHYAEWVEEGRRHYCRESEVQWIACLRREHESLHSALDWAMEHEPNTAARLSTNVWYYWWTQGLTEEAIRRLQVVLDSPDRIDARIRGDLQGALGTFHDLLGDSDAAVDAYQRSLALHEGVGNLDRAAWALQHLGIALRESGDTTGAREVLERALAIGRETENLDRQVFCFQALGSIALLEDDLPRAERVFREGLIRSRRQGNTGAAGWCLVGLGDVAQRRDAPGDARKWYEEALARFDRQERRIDLATVLRKHAGALYDDGEGERAKRDYTRALSIYQEIGYVPGVYQVMMGVAEMIIREGDVGRGIELLSAVVSWVDVEKVTEPGLRKSLARMIRRTRGEANRRAFRRAWRRGRALSRERLLAVADELVPSIELAPRQARAR